MMNYNPDFGGTDVPLVPGSLRGYRVWRLAPTFDGTRLGSINYLDTSWQKGINTATCMTLKGLIERTSIGCSCKNEACVAIDKIRLAKFSPDHQSPSPTSVDGEYCGTCGLYAFHAPTRLLQDNRYTSISLPQAGAVGGSVKATGFTVVGNLGFRSRFAEIEALFGPEAHRVADYYEVPWFETIDDLLERFPADETYTALERTPYDTWPVLFSADNRILSVREDPESGHVHVFEGDVPTGILAPGWTYQWLGMGVVWEFRLTDSKKLVISRFPPQ